MIIEKRFLPRRGEEELRLAREELQDHTANDHDNFYVDYVGGGVFFDLDALTYEENNFRMERENLDYLYQIEPYTPLAWRTDAVQ